jgi:DNA-binding transcriptional LysR family regulator
MLMDRRIKPGLARFQETHPHIELQFVCFSPAADGIDAVSRGEADVLICTGSVPESSESAATEVISRVTCSLYGAPTLVRPVLQGRRNLADLPFLLLPDQFRFTQWALAQFARKGVNPAVIAARPPYMDVLLQMVLAGKGVAPFFDVEIATHLRAGRVLPCGPLFDSVARIMITSPRARSPEAAPLLAFLRNAVRRDDEAIATQHAQHRHTSLLTGDNRLARMTGM